MSLDDVVYEQIGLAHSDARRDLHTPFNGNLEKYGLSSAQQAKLAVLKENAILGCHYHTYHEFFYLVSGEGIFTLQDMDTKETREYDMKPGTILSIPPHIPHKAELKAGSILFAVTEKAYISPEVNDHKYSF